jgi:anti-sigma factor RsiW
MDCQELPIDDFVDDLLDAESRASIAAHLRECSICAAQVDALMETRDLLQRTEPIKASTRFERRVEMRLRQDGLKRDGVKLLAFALAALVVFLRMLLDRSGEEGASTTSFPEG